MTNLGLPSQYVDKTVYAGFAPFLPDLHTAGAHEASDDCLHFDVGLCRGKLAGKRCLQFQNFAEWSVAGACAEPVPLCEVTSADGISYIHDALLTTISPCDRVHADHQKVDIAADVLRVDCHTSLPLPSSPRVYDPVQGDHYSKAALGRLRLTCQHPFVDTAISETLETVVRHVEQLLHQLFE